MGFTGVKLQPYKWQHFTYNWFLGPSLYPLASMYGIFYLHLVDFNDFYGKCIYIYHTWMLWVLGRGHHTHVQRLVTLQHAAQQRNGTDLRQAKYTLEDERLEPTWMSQEVSKWLVNGLQPTYNWGILGL